MTSDMVTVVEAVHSERYDNRLHKAILLHITVVEAVHSERYDNVHFVHCDHDAISVVEAVHSELYDNNSLFFALLATKL